jgi:hypothetical protein
MMAAETLQMLMKMRDPSSELAEPAFPEPKIYYY